MKNRLYINPRLITLFNFASLVTLGLFWRRPQSTLIRSSEIAIGCALFATAIALMIIAHRVQKQAHRKAGDITELVTTGIYSKCRHPIYLAFIVMNIAAVLLFGNIWLIAVALPFVLLWHFEARQEEKFLLDKFGHGYKIYMRRVPMWNVFQPSRS